MSDIQIISHLPYISNPKPIRDKVDTLSRIGFGLIEYDYKFLNK
jgi:hypothetical protein